MLYYEHYKIWNTIIITVYELTSEEVPFKFFKTYITTKFLFLPIKIAILSFPRLHRDDYIA